MTGGPLASWIDGVPAATLGLADRGLHYGDGLFETIACVRGRPRLLPLHLQRLAAGCERLGFEPPPAGELAAEVRRAAAASDRSIVKVIVTRGDAVARGYGACGAEITRRIVLRYAWPEEEAPGAPVAVRLGTLRLAESPHLAGLKHLNRLEQVLARAEWRDPAIAESLHFSASGALVSGTASNVFLARDGGLLTPSLECCGVAGVMRRAVIEHARRQGIAVEAARLGPEDLRVAAEVFLTSARIGIRSVSVLDGRPLPPPRLAGELYEGLRAALEDPAE
jgi:4-amino-4-deoxychorismate lyase